MMRLLSYYTVNMPWTLVYMLQQAEYSPAKFLRWVAHLPNLFQVQKRGHLELTARAKLMLGVGYAIHIFTFLAFSFSALWFGLFWLFLGLLLLPLLCIAVLFITTLLLQTLIVNPRQNQEISRAQKKLAGHKALRIAVLGSYGKTTMKELLVTVLSEAKHIAATPGNKNVLISHARWVNQSVTGDEDVLVFEYGEAGPGDISKLAAFSKPNIAVVTGSAPAHLDAYMSLDAIADDFAAIQKFVEADKLYVNDASAVLREKIKGVNYGPNGVDGWEISNVTVGFDGTSFTLSKDGQKLQLKSGLLGAHQSGPLAAVVAIASNLGLSTQQITAGVFATQSFEHRMQPRAVQGAWILDDTYNGNIEGMRAGLELLKALPGKRKVYVTPGLVDQGSETESVHLELGKLIADAAPDKVVLMHNSVTDYIKSGLSTGGFKGELAIESNPLEYYTNLEHFLAAGDVVMLQNDWPDSYR